MNQSKRKIIGQGMTEYIIIVALIAIAAIGVFTGFGDVVRGQVGAMAAELGGTEGTTGAQLAAEGAQTATDKSTASTLSDYSANN